MDNWTCECGQANESNFCVKCGKPKPAQTVPEGVAWICTCGCKNTKKFCTKCGKQRTEAAASPSARQGESGAGGERHAGSNFSAEQDRGSSQGAGPSESPARDATAPSASRPPGSQENATAPTFLAGALSGKKLLFAGLALVLAAGVYMGQGPLQKYFYDSDCKEFLISVVEAQDGIRTLSTLSNETMGSQPKDIIAKIESDIKKIESIQESLKKRSASNEDQTNHEGIMRAVESNDAMLKQAVDFLQSMDQPDAFGQLKQKEDELVSSIRDAETASEGVAINDAELSQLVSYQEILDNIRAYAGMRLENNEQYMEYKREQYRAEQAARNNALKMKKEVVFLTENVAKAGDDLVIQGNFYNGSGDQVSGIDQMLVDVKLSQFDREIKSITDVPFQDDAFKAMELAPNAFSGAVSLRLPGAAPAGEFNNCVVHVHKIHWRVRRLVKR